MCFTYLGVESARFWWFLSLITQYVLNVQISEVIKMTSFRLVSCSISGKLKCTLGDCLHDVGGLSAEYLRYYGYVSNALITPRIGA